MHCFPSNMLCNSSVDIGCGLMGCYFLIQCITKSALACPLFCFFFCSALIIWVFHSYPAKAQYQRRGPRSLRWKDCGGERWWLWRGPVTSLRYTAGKLQLCRTGKTDEQQEVSLFFYHLLFLYSYLLSFQVSRLKLSRDAKLFAIWLKRNKNYEKRMRLKWRKDKEEG